ncbi:hypothetical protein KIH41_00695 [Litoribacter ruber]|uniref:hypothetical protein n=1 Tax=Litoribacter ruber TaxID=702568 RepID=UPI001BDA9A10|nr:hypothetical protein [Litoribacter ruber]MBT0809791.1 hypothetical protein [Litoribacter ruber]
MKIFSFLAFAVFLLAGCSSGDIGFSSIIQDGETDGSFQINKITHGDTPVWLMEEDVEKLETLYASIETIEAEKLALGGNVILNMDFEDLHSHFSLSREKVEGDNQWYAGNDLRVFVKNDQVVAFEILSIQDFLLENRPHLTLNLSTIHNFKKNFPTSYSLRNRLDPYLMNFTEEDEGIVYDYAYLKLKGRSEEIHFRYIDGEIVQITID